ncbi:MAG: DUF4105 domain-containing protein [Bacteroidota bacterium]
MEKLIYQPNMNNLLKRTAFLIVTFILFINFSLISQQKYVNPIKLSDQSQISIITIDRADEQLFQAFGHICIFIYDPVNQIDKVYSYGSFEFDTENFYWKFITGQLPYKIAASNLQYTLLEYSEQYENRSVFKQDLNLSMAQKQRVFDVLEENLLPENKTYQYKFFQDNCSTRIRDVFKNAMGDSLQFSTKGIEQNQSFRFWMNKNLPNTPWARFGMNLAIGNLSDQPNTNEETFYIPDNLRIAFDNATNGGKPIVQSKVQLFQSYRPIPEKPFPITPSIAFSIVAVFGLIYSYFQFKKNSQSHWFDRILFVSTGLLGCLILFLWFFTEHGVTTNNWNILWAWPTNLLFAFLLTKKSKNIQTYLTVYQLSILISVGLGIGWGFFKSEIYPFAIIPILLLLLVRISLLKINLKAIEMN